MCTYTYKHVHGHTDTHMHNTLVSTHLKTCMKCTQANDTQSSICDSPHMHICMFTFEACVFHTV